MLEHHPWLKWSVIGFLLLQWASVWVFAQFFSNRAADVFRWLVQLSFIVNPIFLLVMTTIIFLLKKMKTPDNFLALLFATLPFWTVFICIAEEVIF